MSRSGFLPEREAGALEVLRDRGLAGAAGLVPHLAADLVERVGGKLDHVERVDAALGVRAALGNRAGDPGGHVARHQFHLFAALFPELVEEPEHRRAIAASACPHQPAGVVVDHDGQVAVALAVRDLVDPDPLEA